MSLREELQDSYRDLLDRIRYTVDSGKTSLEDAWESARDELERIGELTEDELDELGQHVKEDLHEAALQAQELREGLRDFVEFERGYIGADIKDKLLQIADRTTLDMAVLQAELEERRKQRGQA
ncbi:hypothetical protein Q4485_10745 [Granulosicoccaceae sp. 1_MG-2023]|nr:hypothetical protein [Granulosicoccaceae sp. 1_MG-2023]